MINEVWLMKEHFRLKIHMGYWSKSMEQFCKKAYKYIEEKKWQETVYSFSASHMHKNRKSSKIVRLN